MSPEPSNIAAGGHLVARQPATHNATRVRVTPTPNLAFILTATIAVLLLLVDTSHAAAETQIVVCSLIVIGLVMTGINRARNEQGRLDAFHPLVAPMIYVAFSFLAPTWWYFVMGEPVGLLGTTIPIAQETPTLLAIGVIGFSAGACLRFPPRTSAPVHKISPEPEWLVILGRACVLGLITLEAVNAASGRVLSRGVGQVEVAAHSTISALLVTTLSALVGPVAIGGVTLILMGHRITRQRHVLAHFDWVMVFAMILLIGATGSRGQALSVMILIALAYTQRSTRLTPLMAAAFVMLLFSLAVLQYRNAARDLSTPESASGILLGDMSVAAFTVGATAAQVPAAQGFASGRTVESAMIRQLPGPLARTLFGPPRDAGTQEFRNLIHLTNPNQGVGFSLPAEGYLNYGRAGILGFMCILGGFCAWAYARLNFASGRAVGVLYPIIMAGLPLGLRSDVLGATKSILYPMVIIWLALLVARRRAANGGTGASRLGRRSPVSGTP